MEKVYEALYCPCIHESAYSTLSIHKTEKGANEAVKTHKISEKKRWKEMYEEYIEEDGIRKTIRLYGGWNEDIAYWVKETELKE